MKTKNTFQTTGTIIQRHTGDCFKVKLTNGKEILGYVANRFKIPAKHGRGMKRPNIIEGDKVKVELDYRDFSKGVLVSFIK